MRYSLTVLLFLVCNHIGYAQGIQASKPADSKYERLIPETLAIGTTVGYIEGKDVNGKPLPRISFTQSNTIYLIDFWFIQCSPCVAAIPKLVELHNQYKAKGLVVVGLNSFDTMPSKSREFDLISFPKEKVVELVNQYHITYPLYFTDHAIDKQFRVRGYPTLYLVQNGKVIFAHVGYTEESIAEIKRILEKK
jgi:thiol-disulfide isomerase/thioredoxin